MKQKIWKYLMICFLVLGTSTTFINAKEKYDHIDVRFAGKLTIDKKVDHISQSGYPKEIDVDVSDVHAIVNDKKVDTFYEKSGTGIEHEWRSDRLNLSTKDSVTIKCKISGKEQGVLYSVDFEKTYTEKELEKAIQNCPGKNGFDFDINAKDIEECFTSTVTFKSEVGGKINDNKKDIIYSGLINGEKFPSIPVVTEENDYEFIGWAQLINKEKIDKAFPKTVKEDTTWIAQFKKVFGSVSFIKTNENNMPLENAIYKLENENNTYVATSNEDGKLLFNNIKLGSYTLVETQAPEGYLLDPTIYNVEITKDKRDVVLKDVVDIAEKELLKIEKKVNVDSVQYKDSFIYTICIENTGNVTMDNIEVKDTIDPLLDVLEVNGKVSNDNEVNYTIASLKPLESYQINILVKANTEVKKDTLIKNVAFVDDVKTNESEVLLLAKKVVPPTKGVDTADTSSKTTSIITLVVSLLVIVVAMFIHKKNNK